MGINIQGRTGWSSYPHSIGRSRLPHPTVHLLFNLLTHAEGFNATYSIITEQTGMSSKTISAALDNLKKLDLISVSKVGGRGGKFDSNQYTFHADRLWKLTPEFVDERLRGKKPAVEGKAGKGGRFTRESGTAVGGKAAPLYEGKTKKNQEETSGENDHPPLTPQGESAADAARGDDGQQPALVPDLQPQPPQPSPEEILEAEFDEWYDTYPRKRSRGDALKAWKQVRPKASLTQLHQGLTRAISEWKSEGRHVSKIPYPATWLRAESWADDGDDWQVPQQNTPQAPANGFHGGFRNDNTLAAWGAPSTQQQPTTDSFGFSTDPFANMRNVIDHQEAQ